MALQGVLAVLPLLIMALIGFSCAKLPWFGRRGLNFLSKFTIGIAIPLYLFSNVTRVYSHRSELIGLFYDLRYPVILVVISVVLSSIAAKLLDIKPPQRGVFINATSFSNIVVMGMPVVVSLFGEEVLPILMIFYACNTISYWTLGVWLLRREAEDRMPLGVWGTIKEVLSNRPLQGFLLGLLWIFFELPIPGFINKTLIGIGNSVTLLAMMFIGSVIRFADFSSISRFRELILLLGYRYLLVPLFSGFFCWMLPVDSVMKQVFFILSNMPAMAQLPIMAKEVRSDYELASMATALTTAICMVAIPVYIMIMEYTQVFA
jgi:Predicted permeases